jgi:hypothetical protein
MSNFPKMLIFLAILSLFMGICFKLLSIDITTYFGLYPFQPRSFLNFSNTILLLAIAFLLLPRNYE